MLTPAQRAALTARLRQGRRAAAEATPDAGLLVDLGGSGPVAAFAVHAVSGSAHEYAPLAAELSGAVRLRGIQAAGLRPGTMPAGSLDEMAQRYAAAVAAAEPGTAVWLVGWSMGGVLAYETARQLAADGERVAVVVLIDAPSRTVPAYADSEEGLAALFVAEALRGAGRAVPGAPGSAPRTREPVARQLDELVRELSGDTAGDPALREEVQRRWAVFAAHLGALAGYEPSGPLDADAILVGAADTPDSTAEWATQFAGRSEVWHSDAGHYGCLRRPAVTTIAGLMRAVAQVRDGGVQPLPG